MPAKAKPGHWRSKEAGGAPAAPPREPNEVVLARSAGLQAMRQKALEQQRLLREQHQEKIAQLMVEQRLQGLQGLHGFQALQGLPGLQGALLHDAQRQKTAEVMAARQAYAQQMSELVARHEHQIAAASRRAPPPLTPAATAHGAYGCSPRWLRPHQIFA